MTISTQTEQVQWGFHDYQHSDRAGTVGGSMTISTQTEQVQWGFHDHQHSDRAGTVGGSMTISTQTEQVQWGVPLGGLKGWDLGDHEERGEE